MEGTVLPLLEDAESGRVHMKQRQDHAEKEDRLARQADRFAKARFGVVFFDNLLDFFVCRVLIFIQIKLFSHRFIS